MNHYTSLLTRCASWAGVALFSASVATAQLSFDVSVDTSALTGSVGSPLYLDFQLNDGSGVPTGNNSAVISGFTFSGGSIVGSPNTFGGATGDLGTSVWLTDTDAFNEFFQGFVPGSWLSFTVTLSTLVDPVPDMFSFAILDSALANIPTTAWGTDALIEVNIDSASPTIATYASLDGLIPAPMAVPVPEPSTYALWAAAGLTFLMWRRRHARAT